MKPMTHVISNYLYTKYKEKILNVVYDLELHRKWVQVTTTHSEI